MSLNIKQSLKSSYAHTKNITMDVDGFSNIFPLNHVPNDRNPWKNDSHISTRDLNKGSRKMLAKSKSKFLFLGYVNHLPNIKHFGLGKFTREAF